LLFPYTVPVDYNLVEILERPWNGTLYEYTHDRAGLRNAHKPFETSAGMAFLPCLYPWCFPRLSDTLLLVKLSAKSHLLPVKFPELLKHMLLTLMDESLLHFNIL